MNPQEDAAEPRGLLKESIAARLREEILAGDSCRGRRLSRVPGLDNMESPNSIREALNILMAEGFVTKGHGRSARVLKSGMPTSFTSTRSAAHLKAWRRELSPNVVCH